MRERFYGPIVNQTVMYLDVLTNSQFIAIFQGLCICGPNVLKTESLNAILNQFTQRFTGSENQEALTFDQVVTCFELVHNFQHSLR